MYTTAEKDYSRSSKTLNVGDYVSYTFSLRGTETKNGKGYISQITSHAIYIEPDNAAYNGHMICVAFTEMLTRDVKIMLLSRGDN